MDSKICKACLIVKPVSAFRLDKKGLLGRCSQCKECRKKHDERYRKAKEVLSAPTALQIGKGCYAEIDKGLIKCSICLIQKPIKSFYKDRSSKHGYSHRCKACNHQRANSFCKQNPSKSAARRAKRRASGHTPQWAEKEEIQKMYDYASQLTIATGIKHHVDHIIPLNSDLVCGLHVLNNLQVIPGAVNLRKNSRFASFVSNQYPSCTFPAE